MSISGAILISVLSAAVFLLLPAMIGIYVYRDASRRGMNAVLWTVVAVLAPVLVGFIIYLLVRGAYSDLLCPRCMGAVTEEYGSCPHCGAKLKPVCPNCTAPVEVGWRFCPTCASPLSECYEDVLVPVRKKDKALGKILVAVVLIPFLLFSSGLVLFLGITPTGSGGTGVTSLPIGEYLEEMQNPQIEEWLAESGEYYDRAYILRHTAPWESDIGEEGVKVRYLIYLPCMTEDTPISIGTTSNMFGRTIRLDLSQQRGNSGNTFVLVTCTGKKEPKLRISYGRKKVKCEITDVDYPLGLTDQVP